MAKSDKSEIKSVSKTEKAPKEHTDQQTHPKKHNSLVVFLSGLAVVLLLVITFGTWAKNNLYNTEVFSDHVVSAVQTEPVRNAIAAGVTDKIFADFPVAERLLANTVESFISSQLATERAGNILDKVASNLQERAIRGKDTPVVIDISGFTSTIASIREAVAPDAEPKFELPQGDDARIVILNGDEIPSLQNAGMVMLAILPLAMLGLVVLAIVSWFKVGRKPRYFKIVGTVLLITGTLVLIFTNTTSAQLSLLANNSNQAIILEAVYNEFIGNLQRFQSILIGTGLAIIFLATLWDKRHKIGAFVSKIRKSSEK